MKLLCLFLLIASFASSAIHADPHNEYEQIVSQAFAKLDNGFKSSWAFRRTSTKGEEPTKIGYFDPAQTPTEQWSLISIGDRTPTTEEQQEWVLRRILADEEDQGDMGDLVTPGSVQLLEESETHWVFSFAPAPEEGNDKSTRKLLAQVVGNLRVNKMGHYVEEVFLSNSEPIRPVTGVKIKLFEMRMTFGPASDDGPVVPLSADSNIQGRAFLAVSINELKKVSFSDYLKVDVGDSVEQSGSNSLPAN